MNRRNLCLYARCLLAANVPAQTNAATAVAGRDEEAGGTNDNLVTQKRAP